MNSCDTCLNLETDEDNSTYCTVDMDEDEYLHLLQSSYKGCPYYRPGSEHDIVRKQN